MALQTFLLLWRQEVKGVEEELVRQALEEDTYWAGRLRKRIRPQIYLDGAHNLPALTRLVEFIKENPARLSSSHSFWSP